MSPIPKPQPDNAASGLPACSLALRAARYSLYPPRQSIDNDADRPRSNHSNRLAVLRVNQWRPANSVCWLVIDRSSGKHRLGESTKQIVKNTNQLFLANFLLLCQCVETSERRLRLFMAARWSHNYCHPLQRCHRPWNNTCHRGHRPSADGPVYNYTCDAWWVVLFGSIWTTGNVPCRASDLSATCQEACQMTFTPSPKGR